MPAARRSGAESTSRRTSPFGYRPRPRAVNPKTGKPAAAAARGRPGDGADRGSELFRRRAAGEPWAKLRGWLVANRRARPCGRRWRVDAAAMIKNRTYLGIATRRAAATPRRHRGRAPAAGRRGDLAGGPAAAGDACRQRSRARRCYAASSAAGPAGTRWPSRKDHATAVATTVLLRALGCPEPDGIRDRHERRAAGLDDAVVEAMWEHLERIVFEGLDERASTSARIEDERDELVARRERDRLDEDSSRRSAGRSG